MRMLAVALNCVWNQTLRKAWSLEKHWNHSMCLCVYIYPGPECEPSPDPPGTADCIRPTGPSCLVDRGEPSLIGCALLTGSPSSTFCLVQGDHSHQLDHDHLRHKDHRKLHQQNKSTQVIHNNCTNNSNQHSLAQTRQASGNIAVWLVDSRLCSQRLLCLSWTCMYIRYLQGSAPHSLL